ncbi:transketolase [Bradyrhizobium sp. CIR18]|uniref:transketolase n=1 Tax=Bradyrhizobium sp. CIR18 TaxID=2663839 RepID=UPI0016063B8D|nr:transketolase [Bradyrhizobium sp. CIR18]MBB4367129.1 transketolase [Bradyrhizobium sp. CIR18]
MKQATTVDQAPAKGPDLDARSKAIRRRILQALAKQRVGGHIGPAFSLIEILLVLYDECLRLPQGAAGSDDHDRFILSKGHGCLALYAVLEHKGLISPELLDRYCSAGAPLGGLPERNISLGIEATTGALGHGLPIAVGMALAAGITQKHFRVYVLVGDGELNEGSNWEAAFHAVKHRLANLTVLVDRNRQQSSGPAEKVLPMPYMPALWREIGFNVRHVHGHDRPAIREALLVPLSSPLPRVIICETKKGKGLGEFEGNAEWHYRQVQSLSAIPSLF